MKVLNQRAGPMLIRVLQDDTYESVRNCALEHSLDGWNYGKVYELPEGKGHVMLFKFENKPKTIGKLY